MANLGTATLPIYIRIGEGDEIKAGTIELDMVASPSKSENGWIHIGPETVSTPELIERIATAMYEGAETIARSRSGYSGD